MFEYRCGIKLKNTTVNAVTLKLLRKYFPNTSLAELQSKIRAHDYVYCSDMVKRDGKRVAMKMLREFDKAGIETELFEESRNTPGPWRTVPLSREVFHNMVNRSREIERQVLENIELETEGHISSEAAALIDEHILEEKKLDREAEE